MSERVRETERSGVCTTKKLNAESNNKNNEKVVQCTGSASNTQVNSQRVRKKQRVTRTACSCMHTQFYVQSFNHLKCVMHSRFFTIDEKFTRTVCKEDGTEKNFEIAQDER